MHRIRKLTPFYWVMLGALCLALVAFVSHTVFDWGPKWLMLAASLVILASNIYTFRSLWKQADHPAFHGDKSSSPKASSEPSTAARPASNESTDRPLGRDK